MSHLPPLPLYTLKGDMKTINSVNYFSSDLLCAGTTKGYVHLWDLATKREKLKFQTGQETCLSVFEVDSHLLTQEKGGIIRLWLHKAGSFTEEVSVECPYVGFCKCELALGPSWQDVLVFTPGEHSTINIISLKDKTVVSTLKRDDENLGEIMCLKYFDMESVPYLLTAYESGHICLWDLKVKRCLCDMKLEGTPMDLDFDPKKRMGICGTESKMFNVFQLDGTTSLNHYKSIEMTNPGVSCTRIRPDGKLVALGCWDGRIRLYSWKTLKPLVVLPEHQGTVQDICFSKEEIPCVSSQCLLAAAGKDQRISLWDLYNE